MEILITGANGLLGHHLVPALQERGHTLRALVLPNEDTRWLTERQVTVYPGDIRQPATLIPPMRDVDAVFHLAAMMGVWRPMQEYHAVNVTGTEHVCRAALAAGVRRLIHISSWTVYGMGLGQPAREDFPLRPLQEPYAATKAEGERVVQRMIAQDGLPATIIRPGTFFGPGDRLHFARFADRLRARRWVIIGSGRNALPLVYVTDVVAGLLLALEREQAVGQIYNISHDQPLTQQELFSAIAQEIGVPPPRLHLPYHLLYATAYGVEEVAQLARATSQPIVTRLGVMLFGTDNRHAIDKARRELGYEPQGSLREGVRRAAEWYRGTSSPATRAHERAPARSEERYVESS